MANRRLVVITVAVLLVAAQSHRRNPNESERGPEFRVVDARVVGQRHRPLRRGDNGIQSRARAASDLLLWRQQGDQFFSRWVGPALALGRELEVIEAAQRRLEHGPDYDALVALSAAYVSLAHARHDIEAAVRAVDSASRAVLLEPGRAEGWFNRAIALEAVGLEQWTAPWQAYRRVDSRSEWSDEAGLRAASGPSRGDTALSGEQLRTRLEYDLVPKWAAATLQNDAASAADSLHQAELLASDLSARFHERLMGDYLEEIKDLRDSERRRYALAVTARQTLRHDLQTGTPTAGCLEIDALTLTLSRFMVASRLLALDQGSCAYYLGKGDAARQVLGALVAWAEPRHHNSLRGRALVALAAVKVRGGGSGSGDVEYSQARSALRAAGEVSLLASVCSIWAQQLHEQGDDPSAWALMHEAFQALPRDGSAIETYTVFGTATELARSNDLDGLAWIFSDQLLRAAERSMTPAIIGDALSERALVASRLGRLHEANTALDAARSQVRAVHDPEIRRVAQAVLDEASARVRAWDEPCAASDDLKRALEGVKRTMHHREAALYRDLAQTLERCGRASEARAAYRAGVTAFQNEVAEQSVTERRVSHTAALWDLYSGLAALEVDHFADADRGLQALVAGRRAWSRERIDPFDPSTVLRDSGASGAVTYLVQPEQTLAWATTEAGTSCVRIPISAARLQALVDQWTSQVSAGLSDRVAGRVLYDLLVAPVEHATHGALTVVLQDGPLEGIAFGALWTGDGYLVERTAVWHAGSLSDLISSDRVGVVRGPPSALVVGNPSLDWATESRLPALANAESEAEEIAALYPASVLLTRQRATRAAVLESLRRATVVHVAAHGVVNLSRPFDSRIPLAGGEEAALRAQDLVDLPPAQRIIVLASCLSAAGLSRRGFGATSLARAFAMSGSSAAVGALWQVDDEFAPAVATELHRQLVAGWSIAQAVRRTQLAMLARPDAYSAPRVWAAMIGTGVPNLSISAGVS